MDIDFSNSIFTPSSPRTWPQLLNLKQAAQILGVSPWTLRKWDNEGRLKAVRIGTGKHRRYKKDEIIRVTQEGV